MCPACIATMALICAGATSTGGVSALAIRKLRAKTGARANPATQTGENKEENKMSRPKVVSRAEWLVARKELLHKEK